VILLDGQRINCGDYERSEANARLIAAAPDLLAALETLQAAAAVDGWPAGWGLVQEQTAAAIAKCKG